MVRDTQIPDGLLDSKAAREYLGISEQTMKRRRDAGAIRPVRLKGDAVRWQELYYRIEDLERLKRGGHTGHDDHDNPDDHDDETAS